MWATVLCALGPEAQLAAQYRELLNFLESSNRILRQEGIDFAAGENLYDEEFFVKRLADITGNFERLLERIQASILVIQCSFALDSQQGDAFGNGSLSEARTGCVGGGAPFLSLKQACKMRGVASRFEEHFGQYVSLDAYETSILAYCAENQPGIDEFRRAFEVLFPLQNDSERLTNLYGEIAYGNGTSWMWYPVSGREFEYGKYVNMFSNYNEIIFAPIDFSASVEDSGDLQRRIFTFQLNGTTEENDQTFEGSACGDVCQIIIEYIEDEENEEEGRTVVFYDALHYYSLTDAFVYGYTGKLVAWMREIASFDNHMPCTERIFKMVTEVVEEIETHESRFYVDERSENERSNKYPDSVDKYTEIGCFPLIVQIILPETYIVEDYEYYSVVLSSLKGVAAEINVLCFKEGFACDYLNSDFERRGTVKSPHFEFVVSQLDDKHDIYDAMLRFKTRFEQSGLHEYALRIEDNNGNVYLTIGEEFDQSQFYFAQIPLQYLLEIEGNYEILSHSSLQNNYDFHVFGRAGKQSHDINTAIEELSDRERGLLLAKSNICVTSVNYIVCRARIPSLEQISAVIAVHNAMLVDAPVGSRPGPEYLLDESVKKEVCYYLDYTNPLSECTVYLYPLPYGNDAFFEIGAQNLHGGLMTQPEYDLLIDQLINYQHMSYNDFLEQTMIKNIAKAHDGDPLTSTLYLYLLGEKDKLLQFKQEVNQRVERACPNYHSDMIQVCVAAGVDVFMCSSDNAMIKITGFEEEYPNFRETRQKHIFSVSVKCFDVFENSTEDGCHLILMENEQYQTSIIYFFMFMSHQYKQCFYNDIYNGYDELSVPAGIYDLDNHIYTDLNGLPLPNAYSLMLQTGTAFCQLVSKDSSLIEMHLSDLLQSLSSGGSYAVEDKVSFFRFLDNKIYILYHGDEALTDAFGCENTSFNILYDKNGAYRSSIRRATQGTSFVESVYIESVELRLYMFAIAATLGVSIVAVLLYVF